MLLIRSMEDMVYLKVSFVSLRRGEGFHLFTVGSDGEGEMKRESGWPCLLVM